MAKTCPKCRTENAETARFCSYCASPMDPAEEITISRTQVLEPPREELATGAVFAGRYRIIEELGRGGMGRVYRALDQKINEEVALKLIRPGIASEKRTLERFGNELKIARKIAHKNVGKMYHLSEDRGTHYITMEYIRGEDLKRMIRMSKQLSIATAVGIAGQIAEGLAEAHRLGVVHRDLKPANIMIDREGDTRIMDFGIARLLGDKGITGAGVVVGTPDYMSPEQFEGKDIDGRADIYSLGIILYEMVTGRVPFEGDTALAVAYLHKNERPVSPRELNPQVPEDLSGLILKCLEKEPGRRFQTAEEVRTELVKIEKGLPTTAHAPAAPKRTPLTSREITIKFTARKLIIPGVAIVVLVAAVILAFTVLPRRSPTQMAGLIHKQITFTGNADNPAISPDGKFLAYADSVSANEQKIMVRDVVGEQTIEVGRGRNCSGLRWSPDGSELSFCSQKIDATWSTWIVPRLGGPPREFAGIYFAAWSPDGSQLASWSDEKRQIAITSRTTGESKFIATDKPLPPYAEDLDWSPSGKLLVLSMYDEDDNYSVWTMSVDGHVSYQLVGDPSFWGGSPRWSPRGDAVYYLLQNAQTTSIWRIPVSPETGRPAKPPAPVLEGLQIGAYFTLAKDGKTLAYARMTQYSNLWLVTLGGPGKSQRIDIKQLTTGTQDTSGPSLSPDGTLVAYVQGKDAMNVFVMPTEGGPSRQLTFMKAWNGGPVWSPDGKEIAFGSNQGDMVRIWKVDAAGGQPQPFAKAEGIWPSWAPGRKILFQAFNKMTLMALNPATGDVATLLKSDADWMMTYAAWSPDGKKVALRWKKESKSAPGIWIFSPDDASEILLRKGSAVPMGWSADGGRVYAWEPIPQGANVLEIALENGQAEILSTLPLGPEIGRMWFRPHTVDGKSIVFSGRKSQSDIWLMGNFEPEIK